MIRTPYQISAGLSNQEAYAGWVTWHAWMREKVQVGFWWRKSEGKKRPLGRPRRKREACLNMYLQELGGESGLDSSGSGLRRVAGCCEHGNELSDITQCNFLTR